MPRHDPALHRRFPALYRSPQQARQTSARNRPLPAPRQSSKKLIRLAPEKVALFRFLLEAYENLAYFSVLERRTALLKLVYSPQQERAVQTALSEMQRSLPFSVQPWPLDADS